MWTLSHMLLCLWFFGCSSEICWLSLCTHWMTSSPSCVCMCGCVCVSTGADDRGIRSGEVHISRKIV